MVVAHSSAEAGAIEGQLREPTTVLDRMIQSMRRRSPPIHSLPRGKGLFRDSAQRHEMSEGLLRKLPKTERGLRVCWKRSHHVREANHNQWWRRRLFYRRHGYRSRRLIFRRPTVSSCRCESYGSLQEDPLGDLRTDPCEIRRRRRLDDLSPEK